MNLIKIVKIFVFLMFFFKTGFTFTLVYEFSLLVKRLQSGVLHCVWNPYLYHESRLRTSRRTKEKIIKEKRDAIEGFARETNFVAYVEKHSEYNSEIIKKG